MTIRLLLLGLSVVFLSESLASAQVGCTRIDNSMPAQFLSYELLEESKGKQPQVLLRFRNNTNCPLTVLSYEHDLRALVLKRRTDGSPEIRVVGPEDFPDGKRVEVKYFIEYQQPLPPPKKVIFIDEVLNYLSVQPGHSIIFAVPLARFDYLISIQIPFRYDWDSDFYLPSHTAVFANDDLPANILRRTKSCSQFESCKPARTKHHSRRSAN